MKLKLMCLVALVCLNVVISKNWRKFTHKRKTLTNKYLENNYLTQAQEHYTTNLTNADFLLKGYDIYKADPLTPEGGIDPGFQRKLFNKTWGELTSDKKYFKLLGFDISSYDSCSASLSSRKISTVDELSKELKWSVGGEVMIPSTPVSVGAGYGESSVSKQVNNGQNVIIVNTATCIKYKYSFQPQENIVLSNDLIFYLKQLQNRTFAESPELFYGFYDQFGTHYQKSGYMGSKMNYVSQLSASQVSSLESKGYNVEVSIGVKVGPASIKAKGSYSENTEVSKQLNTSNLITKIYSIGAPLRDTSESGSINAWAQETEKNPLPITISVDHITNLLYLDKWEAQMAHNNITRIKVIAQLNRAYDTYCKYLASKYRGYSCETKIPSTLGERHFSPQGHSTSRIDPIITNTKINCKESQAIHYFRFNFLHDGFGYNNDFAWEWLCSQSGNISRDCYNKQSSLITITGKMSDLNPIDIICQDGYVIKSYNYEIIDSTSFYADYYCCKANINNSCDTKIVSFTSDLISDLSNLSVNGDNNDPKSVLNSIDFNWDSETELMSFKYRVCTLKE